MVDKLSHTQNSWENTVEQSSRVMETDNNVSLMSESLTIHDGIGASHTQPKMQCSSTVPDTKLGFPERAFSAAGAAVLSAILVNPLDVAKVLALNFIFVFLLL